MFRSITPSLIRRLKIACGIVALCVFFGSIISNGTVKTAYADEGGGNAFVEELQTRCGRSIDEGTRLSDLWLNAEDSNNNALKQWFPGFELEGLEDSSFAQDNDIDGICDATESDVPDAEGDPYFDERVNPRLYDLKESSVFDDYPWTFKLLPFCKSLEKVHYYLSNDDSKQLMQADEVLAALKQTSAHITPTLVLEGTSPTQITPAWKKLITTEKCAIADNTTLSTSLSSHAFLRAKLTGAYPFGTKGAWNITTPLSSEDVTDIVQACTNAHKPLQFVSSTADIARDVNYTFKYDLPIFLAKDKKTATISEEGIQFIKKYLTTHDRSASISGEM